MSSTLKPSEVGQAMLADPILDRDSPVPLITRSSGLMVWQRVEYAGLQEPPVDSKTFVKIQDLSASRSRRWTREVRHQHYLKGLLICAICGRGLSIQRSKNRYGMFGTKPRGTPGQWLAGNRRQGCPRSRPLQVELVLVERPIQPTLLKQPFVRSSLHQTAVLEHEDHVSREDG